MEGFGWVLLGVLLSGACQRNSTPTVEQHSEAPLTNRIALSPETAANLGITFAQATRGRIAVVVTVLGELQVPEHRRWTLRAPASGRVAELAARWQTVAEAEVVAEIASPDLRQNQQDLLAALSASQRSEQESEAAAARLVEAEVLVQQATTLAAATEARLRELGELASAGNALIARERIEAQRASAEAASNRLETAVRRDELRARAAQRQLDRDRTKLAVDQQLAALSLLTGLSTTELVAVTDGTAAWTRIDVLRVSAPASGTVVELHAAPGEAVAGGAPLLSLMDARELRFVGIVPEGDLGELRDGAPVRIEPPGRDPAPVETQLIGPLPVADPRTRTRRVEAIVPNAGQMLAHGMSALAHVRVAESEHDEVLLPAACVVFDGLEAIVFRREPTDSTFVVRTPVELGRRGGDLVEVLAGVAEGDAVVAAGSRQLAQSGIGKGPQGGHFHADGTWHEDHK